MNSEQCQCSTHENRSTIFTANLDLCDNFVQPLMERTSKRDQDFLVRQLEFNNADLEAKNQALSHKFLSAQEKIEDLRRKMRSGRRGRRDRTSPRSGASVNAFDEALERRSSSGEHSARDELREILLRRLRIEPAREKEEREMEEKERKEKDKERKEQEKKEMERKVEEKREERRLVPETTENLQHRLAAENPQHRVAAERWSERAKELQREKGELEKRLIDKEAEIAALRQKEGSLSSGCDDLRSELESTTRLLQESRGSLEQMTRDHGALQESLGSTQKTSESIVVKLQEAESNWKRLEKTKAMMDEELNTTRAEQVDFAHKIAFLEEKATTETEEKQKLLDQNQKLEQQCAQMHAIHEALRQQLATIESMCSNLQKKKQTVKGDLKDQLNDLYKRIDVLSAEKTSLLLKNENVKTQFEETQKLLTNIRVEHASLQNSVKDKDDRISLLKKKLTRTTETATKERRAREDAENLLRGINNRKEEFAAELQKAREQMKANQTLASKRSSEAERWASTAQQLKTQLESRETRDRAIDGKSTEAQRKLEMAEEELARQKAQAAATQHRVRALEGENEWLKGMLEIVKKSAIGDCGAGHTAPLSFARKAGVGADAEKPEMTSFVSREATTTSPNTRRKGSPVGRAVKDSSA